MRRRVIRVWGKAVVLGAGFGLAAGVALYFAWDQIGPDWIEVIDEWLGWYLAAVKAGLPRLPAKVSTVILAFASAAVALTGFLMMGGRRPFIDWLWPEPPDILDLALYRQNVYPDDPRLEGRTFIGRTNELRTLMTFAGTAGGETPRSCTLTAPHGIGKTRLALEWLDRLQKRGWDAGFLDSGATISDIKEAHFRRNTAIVIDEALKDKDLWPKLNALLTPPRRVRILVIDQVPIRPPDTLDKAIAERIKKAQLGGLRIDRLDRAALAAIAPEAAAEILDRADGRPLYVLLGLDPVATVARRVAERFEIAKAAGEKALLAFAALAGPVENAVWQGQHDLPASISLSRRARLFGGADKDALKRVLPALAPEPFADALLLAWATDQDDAARNRLFLGAIAANPSAVIARLRSLWTAPPLKTEEAEAREALQWLFDEARPDLVAAMRQEARRAFARTAESLENDALDEAMRELAAVADVRPRDREVQHCMAGGAVYAMLHYGANGRWDELERWGERLTAVADAWPQVREIQLTEAQGAFSAISDYGANGRWDELERWGERLTAVADAWPQDREIQLAEARGALDAMLHYGANERWDELERWDERLTAVADAWPQDREIQLCEAKGAVNAIYHYGAHGCWTELEEWGERLTAVADAWREDREIQLRETMSAVNAINVYGLQERWTDLERWGERLKAVTHDDAWREDREIQLREAMGTFNAIYHYGVLGLSADMERWNERLKAVAEAWREDREIQLYEAMSAVNAINVYALQGRWTDLERWGNRLKTVAEAWREDREIQLREAMAASNAIADYGKMGLWADLERWGERLKAVTHDDAWREDQEVQLCETKGTFNAINHYGGQARPYDLQRWRARLAAVARAHPGNLGIQELASKLGLGYADQMHLSG